MNVNQSPLHCKTCHTVIGEGTCKYSGDVVTLIGVWSKDVRFVWEHTAKYGCASHSAAAKVQQRLKELAAGSEAEKPTESINEIVFLRYALRQKYAQCGETCDPISVLFHETIPEFEEELRLRGDAPWINPKLRGEQK